MRPTASTSLKEVSAAAFALRLRRRQVLNIVGRLPGMARGDLLVVFVGAPLVVAVFLLILSHALAGLAYSRHALIEIVAVSVGGTIGLSCAPPLWRSAAARFDQPWLHTLPVADRWRYRAARVDHAVLCAGIWLLAAAAAFLVTSNVIAGAFVVGLATGLLAGSVGSVNAARHAGAHASAPRSASRRVIVRWTRPLDSIGLHGCRVWAFSLCRGFIDRGLIWLVAALSLMVCVSATLSGAAETAIAAGAGLGHFIFIATLRTAILHAPALRVLPVSFARAVFGVARLPMALALGVGCLGLVPVAVIQPSVALQAIVVLVLLAAVNLAYMSFSLAARGREGLAVTNYLLLIGIGLHNLPRLGGSEVIIAALGAAFLTLIARRGYF